MVATTTTPKNSTNNSIAAPISEAVHKAGEQLVSAVKQGQNATLDAAKAIAKVTSSVPTPDLFKIEDAPELPDFGALSTYTFDLAIELLTAQRDFAVKLAETFTPAK
jgi:hypothetical protein